MSSAYRPFLDSIIAEVNLLRQAIRTTISDLDDGQFATVMGNQLKRAGLRAPTDLQAEMKADAAFAPDASIQAADMPSARNAVR